jgi:hypothetical protein
MPVHKRRNPCGKIVWSFRFDAPGTTRENRREIRESGFATKDEATKAEATRRVEEQEKFELGKAGSSVAAAPPKTIKTLLEEFFRDRGEVLAPKTLERYRESSK